MKFNSYKFRQNYNVINQTHVEKRCYLQVLGFSPEQVATFIAVLGVLSVLAQVRHVSPFQLGPCLRATGQPDSLSINAGGLFLQTAILALLMKYLGSKHTIMVGLAFEMLQLALYGFGSQEWSVAFA